MISPKHQRGIGLIETVLGIVLVLSIAGLSVPFLMERQKDQEAIAYADHLKNTVTRLHQYQYYKITEEGSSPTSVDSWPQTLNHLMTDFPNRFWNSCTLAQESNDECVRPDYVPWNTQRLTATTTPDMTAAPHYMHYVVTIPLSTLAHDTKEYLRWSVPLMTIPGAQKTATQDIEITLRQVTQSLLYDQFVWRDGNKTLTDDWDVGGQHAISNARDFTIRNSDGSITSVSEGLTHIHSLKPWESLKKPSCPSGLSPDITLSIGSIDITYPNTLTGSIKPYVSSETSNHWTVSIDAYVINANNNTYQRLNTGEIIALTQCRK